MGEHAVTGASAKRTSSGKKPNPPSFWTMAHALALKSEHERIQTIQQGMESVWVEALKKAFDLNRQTLAPLINLSESTLDRRLKARSLLDPVASERLDRIAQVAVLAESVFEDKQIAARWMSTSNDVLGGKTPLSLCDTELGARQVRRVLHSIEWGGVA